MSAPRLDDALAALLLSACERVLPPLVERAVRDAVPEAVRRSKYGPYLTRSEVCELTGWSASKIDGLRRSGRLSWAKHGRRVLVETDSLFALLDSATVAPRTDG